jgi:hypothetical protein
MSILSWILLAYLIKYCLDKRIRYYKPDKKTDIKKRDIT